jgi:serine/threonine protein kinase
MSDHFGHKRKFSLTQFFEIGGQNKIYLGVMKKSEVSGEESEVQIIVKAPLLEKNPKFALYLESEASIAEKLNSVAGIVKSFGLQEIKNQFNNNAIEKMMVLEYCQYGSLHSLSVFTKPYEEPAAYVVLR